VIGAAPPLLKKVWNLKILKGVLLLLVPATALVAFVVAASGVLPYKVYVVHTGSMSPTIPSKSAVIVREEQYEIGQVITFTASGQRTTHRLVSINADGFAITKGDANETADPWRIPPGQIIGGVVAAPRELGYWIVYLRNPVGLASVLVSVVGTWQIWAIFGLAADTESAKTVDRETIRQQRLDRKVRRALARAEVADLRANAARRARII